MHARGLPLDDVWCSTLFICYYYCMLDYCFHYIYSFVWVLWTFRFLVFLIFRSLDKQTVGVDAASVKSIFLALKYVDGSNNLWSFSY
ncbi:hypothetical protein Scep_029516 [Stephania cephalantha]|uniref:Transmembrane protein n=1 Tax=Stephania cephalantha TaxID=152367 RepID=A0AAP0E0T5_9MAGN